jgi:arylsulfatase A-like enzyme
MSRARRAAAAVVALLAAACTSEAPRLRPNVLLISLDSTRRDLLGAYGRRPARAPGLSPSPSLDRLAAEGVLLEEAYATSSWTLPSHLSILTGQPELVHAVDQPYHRPDPLRPLLGEILTAHGYRSFGFFSGPYLEPHFGFARGFEEYRACYGPELRAASTRHGQMLERLQQAERAGDEAALRATRRATSRARQELETLSHRDVSSEFVADAAIEALERAAAAGGGPFFIFAHFFDPHYDYAPPSPWDLTFDPAYEGEVDGRDFIRDPRIARVDPASPSGRRRVVSDRDLEHLLALYEGELGWTDSQVGRLLARLDELGLARDTLVVVTADHGSEFFEHGSIGHRRTLDEEVVRVPLLLRLPGRLPAGRRVAGPVSTVAILPTVLDLTGVPAPESLASTSLVPLIDGREPPGRRGVLARLVRTSSLEAAPAGGEEGRSVGQLVTILETYRKGAIKITREESWSELREPAPAGAAAAPRRSRLWWVDLAASPGEAPEDRSTSFDDPRALGALREFHERYTLLLAQRDHADLREADSGLDARLRGLGYVGHAAEAPLASDEFVLPPPGAEHLE